MKGGKKYASKKKPIYRKKYARKSVGTTKGNAGRSPKQLVNLQYNYSTQLVNATGNLESVSFRMNSIRQPKVALPGPWSPYDACRGWSQWATFYHRYRVYKVSYTIDFVNADPSQPQEVFVQALNNNTAPSDVNGILGQPHTYVKQLGTRDGNSKVTMKGSYYLPKVCGLSSLQYKTDLKTQAEMTRTPDELMHLVIGSVPTIPASTVVNTAVRVKLTYHCELFDPIFIVNFELPEAITQIHVDGDRYETLAYKPSVDPDQ